MAENRCVYLPDPFIKKDGTRLQSPEEWPEQAAYIKELAQEYMYGKWPGHPESLRGEILDVQDEYDHAARRETILLTINNRYPMKMELIRPANAETFPVIINCAPIGPENRCPIEKEVVVDSGYGLVSYDCSAIAPDHVMTPEEAPLYPELECSVIMAWGWGQSVIADYLQERGIADELIATGCSRSGKAALAAGIFDERFAVVAPICSGCGGVGSARFLGTTEGKRQNDARCETVGCLAYHFPHWFIPRYSEFGAKEEGTCAAPFPVGDEVNAFPLDAHLLRAACAPRAVFNSEGVEDHWANAFGTQVAAQAAQKVFDFLGCPEKNAFHIRPEGHAFHVHDWAALIDFCDRVLGRERRMPHDDIDKLYFDIDLKEFAPWAE